ncbi:MAG: hypothetical protein OXD54_12925 [Candidatus Poribacteria bacterium]|nr:hypothetical protein [Candidatus Poribacteria bacterium]
MSKKTILIYDDDRQRAGKFKCKLEKGLDKANQSGNFNVVSLKHGEFQNAIKALEQRRMKFRNIKDIYPKANSPDGAENIDNASMFIIDYDLLGSQVEESPTGSLTGEIIAYLVRCFSKCKLIIGLNQYGNNPFDLTLRGGLDSFADLNLGDQQLGNPNLWMGDWKDSEHEYRPWYWPNLADSIHNFDKRIEEIQRKLDEPICEVLDFDSEVFQLLPREIVQFIGQYEGKEPFQTTFREFVTKSGNGLRSKDEKKVVNGINDQVLVRVCAARISKWLEQLVLPEQDILVDAPHLVSRYPSLIKDDEDKIETWNETARLVAYANLGLDTDSIEPFRFKKSYWISRPVWFWDKLRECEGIKEVTEPWLTAIPDWAFCEDTSCFHEQADCKEFLADIASPFTRRFVRNFDRVNYQPRVRFSL